jgi:hypothetical protein
MTDAKESEKLRELEAIARGNGYWSHIEPFVEAFTRERDALRTQLAAARLENDTQRRAMDFWENYAMPHELPFLHRLRALAPEQQDELLRFGQTLKAMTITAALTQEDA